MKRPQEVAAKLGRLAEWLDTAGADGIRLRGSDWFAWATAGGSNAVLLAAETGVAELLVTREGAFVLTDEIEAPRLREEEITEPLHLRAHPWADPGAREEFVRSVAPGRMLSDRPRGREEALPEEALALRWTLIDGEQDRYRDVCVRAAEALTDTLVRAQPDWTERRLAGEAARDLTLRGLDPALVLAGGERRAERYRHVTPKDEPIGSRAMLVTCARAGGLYANLTRWVSFGPQSAEHRRAFDQVVEVEEKIWAASRAGARLDDLYEVLRGAYSEVGAAGAIAEHHQGGVTGYASRERVAAPGERTVLEPGMGLAWNPSVTGAKIEDTVLLRVDGQLEVLTVDPRWPTVSAPHGERPAVLER